MRIPYLAAVLATVATLACGGSGSSPTSPSPTPNPDPNNPTANVTIQDFSFSPETLTVKAGTTVTWKNQGPSPHTTVSDADVWNSGTIGAPSGSGGIYGNAGSPGGTFSFKFTQAGTFPYHCSLHPPTIYPNFKGTIIVTP